MLVSVQNIGKSFLDKVVLRGVNLEVNAGDRIGLLGANGAGKTTLLNMIAKILEPDEGEIIRARGLEIGYLRQNDALEGENTLQQEAESAFESVRLIQRQMEECAQKLKNDPENTLLLREYDSLQVKFESKEGYHIEDKINRVLTGLGFASFDRNTKVSTLSGGEKMRFGFAKLLLGEPDVLMLDEPTNHLDFSMLNWLEEYLSTYKGAILVVSHDRYFLDAIAKDICEVERCGVSRYTGGYTSFVTQKAERRKTWQRSYEKQQEEIAKMEDYVRRNLARASTTKMAQSRRKTLEKMERISPPPSMDKTISLRFSYDVEPHQSVMMCENFGVSVGEGGNSRELYKDLNLEILREEKIALVGLNGVGKSTFLKAIQNIMPHKGAARWGGNVKLGYFDQELSGLPMDETVLEAVHSRYPTKTEFEIRTALGRLLLEGETVYKKVRELSGAMRAKVAFAILQMQRANVLVLDEPTNHLDYRAKEVLEATLRSFTGTILVVSHDRYFLQRVPTTILEMTPQGFIRYDGNYDDYKAKQSAEEENKASTPQEIENIEKENKPGGKRTKEERAQQAQKRQRISELEKLIAALENEIDEATAALENPENAADFALLTKYSEMLDDSNIALEEAMEEWMGLV